MTTVWAMKGIAFYLHAFHGCIGKPVFAFSTCKVPNCFFDSLKTHTIVTSIISLPGNTFSNLLLALSLPVALIQAVP